MQIGHGAEKQPVSRKRKWWKIPAWIFGGLLGLILLVLIAALLFLDSIARTAVVKVGSEATGTEVKLTSVSILPLRGKVDLSGLAIMNPRGYENPEAIQFKNFMVQVDLSSLSTDKIVIQEIRLSGLELNFELTASGSNLTDIKNNIDNFTKQFASDSEPEQAENQTPPPTEAPPEAEKKVVIRLLSVTDSVISFSNSTLGVTLHIPLPDIELTDVGDGRPLSETVQIVYDAILDAVIQATKAATLNIKGAWNSTMQGFGTVTEAAGNGLSSAANATGKQLDSAADAAASGLKSAGSEVENAAKGVVGGLSDLFRKDKKK